MFKASSRILCLLAFSSTVPVYAVDSDAVIGGAIGGGLGAAVGSEVGGKEGAIVGGAIGGAVGAAIGASDEKETVVVKEKVIVKESEYEPTGHPPGHSRGKKVGWKKKR